MGFRSGSRIWVGLGLLSSFGTVSLGHSGIRDLGQTGEHYHLKTVTKCLCVRYHAGNFRGGRHEHDMASLCKKNLEQDCYERGIYKAMGT